MGCSVPPAEPQRRNGSQPDRGSMSASCTLFHDITRRTCIRPAKRQSRVQAKGHGGPRFCRSARRRQTRPGFHTAISMRPKSRARRREMTASCSALGARHEASVHQPFHPVAIRSGTTADGPKSLMGVCMATWSSSMNQPAWSLRVRHRSSLIELAQQALHLFPLIRA